MMQKVITVVNNDNGDMSELNNLLKEGWKVIDKVAVEQHVSISVASPTGFREGGLKGNVFVYFILEKEED